jgi:hypothetical protein
MSGMTHSCIPLPSLLARALLRNGKGFLDEGAFEQALYLEIAALNGYATAEGIDAAPDLETLRGLPRYQALRQRL